MHASTACVGLLDIGQPRAGETVVVAAATGAVGSTVGQIAKLKGARVVGIAGGPEKCRYAADELGFDICLDRHEPGLAETLAAACPKGIDVYFRSEEHTSELQSLMRSSYAVFCLKKKTTTR